MPVVGFRLLVLVCCWPVVVMPVVTPLVMPSALAVLVFASWLFAVAFVGDVCACTLGAANISGTKTSAAIKASFFIGPTRLCCGLAATLWDVSSTPLLPGLFEADCRKARRPFQKPSANLPPPCAALFRNVSRRGYDHVPINNLENDPIQLNRNAQIGSLIGHPSKTEKDPGCFSPGASFIDDWRQPSANQTTGASSPRNDLAVAHEFAGEGCRRIEREPHGGVGALNDVAFGAAATHVGLHPAGTDRVHCDGAG